MNDLNKLGEHVLQDTTYLQVMSDGRLKRISHQEYDTLYSNMKDVRRLEHIMSRDMSNLMTRFEREERRNSLEHLDCILETVEEMPNPIEYTAARTIPGSPNMNAWNWGVVEDHRENDQTWLRSPNPFLEEGTFLPLQENTLPITFDTEGEYETFSSWLFENEPGIFDMSL